MICLNRESPGKKKLNMVENILDVHKTENTELNVHAEDFRFLELGAFIAGGSGGGALFAHSEKGFVHRDLRQHWDQRKQ